MKLTKYHLAAKKEVDYLFERFGNNEKKILKCLLTMLNSVSPITCTATYKLTEFQIKYAKQKIKKLNKK